MRKKVIIVDIDGTICSTTDGSYEKAIPNYKMISAINKLYDDGCIINYWTARGTTTNIDWTDVTKKQLKLWGCKYHEVKLGKPFYDLFIDDKCIVADDFLKNGISI